MAGHKLSIFLLLTTIFTTTLSQTLPPNLSLLTPSPAPAPAPASGADLCNGIYVSYTYQGGKRLPPKESLATNKQPYRFQSELFILNNDDEELKSWQVFVGFQHDEYLVSATNVIIADGEDSIPAKVGNGTTFSGFPTNDLKTAIQTAGELDLMSVKSKLVGTEFGVKPQAVPLPSNISLVNDGYICPEPTIKESDNRTMSICCFRDPTANSTLPKIDDKFLPLQHGDLTILYDITKSYDQNYWAQVTISNHNPLGRLDYWELSFDWMRGEFIYAMKGAYPSIIDTNDCIFGPQSTPYASLDFTTALNCYRRPTIVDLPPTKALDPTLGNIQYCCRNGTILPPTMNSTKSISSFQLNVYKMPPDFNRSTIYPPQNWKINGTLNPDYKCQPPIRVNPSLYPVPDGELPINETVIATWQIICNITQTLTKPKCCVSFSAFFNDSIVPCDTCACGCSSSKTQTCSTRAPALLIPPEAQLVPFDNRTKLTLAWSSLKHTPVPKPLPCGDNCPVTINWHLATDYVKGWSVRLTVFNWEEVIFPDWFIAVQLKDKAVLGFEKAYSFNGTIMSDPKDTIFMEGLPGLNYLVGETNGTDPEKDPRVPGKQQSVISFTKKTTPGIQVVQSDGFPTKVYFNGEECSLPSYIPQDNTGGIKNGVGSVRLMLIVLGVIMFVL